MRGADPPPLTPPAMIPPPSPPGVICRALSFPFPFPPLLLSEEEELVAPIGNMRCDKESDQPRLREQLSSSTIHNFAMGVEEEELSVWICIDFRFCKSQFHETKKIKICKYGLQENSNSAE